MRTYDDAYLAYWGHIFRDNHIHNLMWSQLDARFHGVEVYIDFEDFLLFPEEIFNLVAFHKAPLLPETNGFYGLLPAQKKVLKQLLKEDDPFWPQHEKVKPYQVRVERNGTLFEPYKYHRRAV